MKIGGVHPDLVVILVIGWAILRNLEESLTWALIAGLCLDFLSGAPFGVFTFTIVVVTLIASLTAHGRVFGSGVVVPLSLTFPLSLLFNVLALAILRVLGHSIIWSTAFFGVLLPVALFNSAVMLVIFPLLYLLNQYFNPQELSF